MGRRRVVIEGVEPQVDGGRFPAKCILGDRVVVEADAFTDGHDAIAVMLLHRRKGTRRWDETPMTPLGNDRWQGDFDAAELCRYLMARGVEEFHIYTLNRADLTAALCRLLRNDARARAFHVDEPLLLAGGLS